LPENKSHLLDNIKILLQDLKDFDVN